VNSLPKCRANFEALSPLNWLERAAKVYKASTALIQVDGSRRTWGELRDRSVKLSSTLVSRGIGRGDVVQVLLDNTAEMVECHYGVPMSGATLGCINTRLDAKSVAFILDHSDAKGLIYDERFEGTVREALDILKEKKEEDKDAAVQKLKFLATVDVKSDESSYEAELVAQGSASFEWPKPEDEWDALSLNYTSGTTGNPKGVVGSHRGIYLTALSNVLAFNGMPSRQTRYLCTVPGFHCNGWSFPYTLAAVGGTSVCLRSVSADSIYEAVRDRGITHMCGAPIVLRFATEALERLLPSSKKGQQQQHTLKMMCAGAAPPPATLRAAEKAGIDVFHVYGLTEVYGPQTKCEWNPDWDSLSDEERALLKARQGVEYATLERLDVFDVEKDRPVPRDGTTMGEVVFQGNGVMKGYLKNPAANDAAFKGDWFRSGDIGVVHPDGYVAVKDRAKDVVISGGENISSLEVEAAIMEHPDVIECAVVPRPDPKWGEHPCCFVETKPASDLTEKDLIAFARTKLAGFKIPKSAVFGPLPKTATGKIQKFVLRTKVKDLPDFA